MTSSSLAGSAAANASGVGHRANTCGVIELTVLSVDWADKMVATSSWNGLAKSSSHSSAAVPGYSTANRTIVSRARPFAVRGRAMAAQPSVRGRAALDHTTADRRGDRAAGHVVGDGGAC